LKELEIDTDGENPYYRELFNDLDYKKGYAVLQKELRNLGERIPPLIQSYLKLTPKIIVFGTSTNPHFGGVEETGMLLSIKDIYPEKSERHILPMSKTEKRLRPIWWRKK
jgi:hypothetical protein